MNVVADRARSRFGSALIVAAALGMAISLNAVPSYAKRLPPGAPPPPAAVPPATGAPVTRGDVLAWGITAPKGGVVFMPGSLGGHIWAASHSDGLCRLDPIPNTTLLGVNLNFCDPDGTIGSPGQPVYNPTAKSDGTHDVWVSDNSTQSAGVWRLTFDPVTESISNPVLMNSVLGGLRINSIALGPDGSLYTGSLADGTIRKLSNPSGDPTTQTIVNVATTQDARGINGTMGFLGSVLYLPENTVFSKVDTAVCPTAAGPCATTSIPVPGGPPSFISGVGTDPAHGFVYVSNPPIGTAPAKIFRYTPANGTTAVLYATDANVPAIGTPNATVWCSITCTRPFDATLTPGSTTGFVFAQGVYIDPRTSALLLTDDPTAGVRAGHGRVWSIPFVP